MIERQKAGGIYDSIVRRRRDPAILKQIGDNRFKMRVFPIPGRDFKRILLDFTLPRESDDGQFHFDLPLFSDREPIWDFQVTGAIRGPTRLESVVSGASLAKNFLAVRHRPRAAVALQSAAQTPYGTKGWADHAGRSCWGPKRAISNSGSVCAPTFPLVFGQPQLRFDA